MLLAAECFARSNSGRFSRPATTSRSPSPPSVTVRSQGVTTAAPRPPRPRRPRRPSRSRRPPRPRQSHIPPTARQGDVAPETAAGKVFGIFFILFGLAFIVNIVTGMAHHTTIIIDNTITTITTTTTAHRLPPPTTTTTHHPQPTTHHPPPTTTTNHHHQPPPPTTTRYSRLDHREGAQVSGWGVYCCASLFLLLHIASYCSQCLLLVSSRCKHTPRHKPPPSPAVSCRLLMPTTRLSLLPNYRNPRNPQARGVEHVGYHGGVWSGSILTGLRRLPNGSHCF